MMCEDESQLETLEKFNAWALEYTEALQQNRLAEWGEKVYRIALHQSGRMSDEKNKRKPRPWSIKTQIEAFADHDGIAIIDGFVVNAKEARRLAAWLIKYAEWQSGKNDSDCVCGEINARHCTKHGPSDETH